MARTAIALRPHVTATMQVMQLIHRGTCWHFDAWMMRDSTGALFVRVETRAGGRDLLTEAAYMLDGDQLRYVPAIPESASALTLNDKAEWPNYDALNAIHTRYILPMAARVPAGFKSRSVALHYVRAPSIEPFGDDVVNLSHYAD